MEILIEYLRIKYLYCVWCGIVYDDSEDLKINCFGNIVEFYDDWLVKLVWDIWNFGSLKSFCIFFFKK